MVCAQKETLKRTLDAVEEKLENQARTATNLQETLTDVLVPALDKTKELDQQKEELSHLKEDLVKMNSHMRGAMGVLMREVQTLQGAEGQGKPGSEPGATPMPSVTREDLDHLMSALTKKIDEVHKDVSRAKLEPSHEPMVCPAVVSAKATEVLPQGSTNPLASVPAGVPLNTVPGGGQTAPHLKFAFRDTSKDVVCHKPVACVSRNPYVLGTGPSIVSGSTLSGAGGIHVTCVLWVWGMALMVGGMCFPCS